MNAKIHVDAKPAIDFVHAGWAGKTALAAALGLGLLVSGCGGGGDAADPAQAAKGSSRQEQAATTGSGAGTGTTADKNGTTADAETTVPDAEADSAAMDADASEADVLSTAPSEAPPKPAALLATSSDPAPLGVNLEGLSDWSRLQPFVDVMKTARPWGTADAPWDEAATVDSLGWPTGDAGVVVNMRTVEPGDQGKAYTYIKAGTYKLKFLGRATIDCSGSTNVTIRNQRYVASTNTTTADVVVGTGSTQLMLAFRNTNGGVRKVSLRQPGYTATAVFTEDFKQALAPFKVVRLMDFLHTNENPVRTWAQRTKPASGSQTTAKGAAIEYGVRIANQLDKDIWINIPVNANDTYVRALAKLLKLNLKPEHAVYVEYSNELWNYQFGQTTENMDAAVAEAVAGDKTLTNGQACTKAMFANGTGECNQFWAASYRVGKRTAKISQIFSEVFGAAAMNKQVRVVYPTQFADPGIAEGVLYNMKKYYGAPSSLIYGIATAPYFYLADDVAASTSASSAQIVQSMDTSLATEDEPFFAAGFKRNGTFVPGKYDGSQYTGATHKALADYYGIKNVAYEGGPDLRQNPANRAAKVDASRSAGMGALVKREVSQWFGCGNDLYMHFSLTSPWDEYGYWGLTNDPTNLDVPKYQAAKSVALSAKSSFTTCR